MSPQPCQHPRSDVSEVRLKDSDICVEVCTHCGQTRLQAGVAGTSWEGGTPQSKTPLFKVAVSPAAPARICEVLKSGYLGEGPVVAEFEKKLSAFLGVENVLCTNSGTSALELAFDCCGITEGTQVISTPMTCLATNAHLVRRNAQIIWADVDRYTGLIDPEEVEWLLKEYPRVRAIVCVDYGGRLCNYNSLHRIVHEHSKKRGGRTRPHIIQDAAHAFRPDMAQGDFTCLSFQAIKHLTCGDGGALVVPPWTAETARLTRWFGLDRTKSESFRCQQQPSIPGAKLHMNDIAAALGLANWSRARVNVSCAENNAQFYRNNIITEKQVLYVPPAHTSPWLYPILVENRADFIQFMDKAGVEVSRVHCRNDRAPVHRFATYRVPLFGVDFFDSHQVCIPVGHWVKPQESERIVELINSNAW